MVDLNKFDWKKFYLIMFIIIFILSLMIIILVKEESQKTIINYVNKSCDNAEEIISLLNNPNIEYEITNNNRYCFINEKNGRK